jgi:lipopolysaccharide transport system ATP-binding protein
VENDGVNNSVRCGTQTTLSFGYSAKSVPKNVHVSITFYDSLGYKVLWLSNDLTGVVFDGIPLDGQFLCKFDKLPLLPGTYDINLFCRVNGEIADWIRGAARIEVVEGDYFGFGKLPLKGFGHLAVPHEWHISRIET